MATDGNKNSGAQEAGNPEKKDAMSAGQPITQPAEEYWFRSQTALSSMLGPGVIQDPTSSAPPYMASSTAIHICTNSHDQHDE